MVLVGIVLAAPVAAQAPPQQLHNIGDLQLQSGSVLESVKLGFRTAGTLNSDRSNILLFPTWFTGTSLELFNNGQIGLGQDG